MKKLTIHQLRALGALAALTKTLNGKKRYFSRLDIGTIVYSHWQGVQLSTMCILGRNGLVIPESKEAVLLVSNQQCRCGCDNWAITDSGEACIKANNVKIPEFRAPARIRTQQDFKDLFDKMFGGSDDPADWWK